MDNQLHKELHDLLVQSLNGCISDAQTKRLNEIVDNDSLARQYCIDFYFLASSLKRPELYIGTDSSTVSSENLQQLKHMQELARYEMTAKTVKIPQTVQSEDLAGDVMPAQIKRKIFTAPLVTTLILTAALIFLMIWVRLTPVSTSKEVATLTDSIKARWSDSTDSITAGTRLVTGYTPMVLQEGIVELSFDTTAKVVIEAPAEFYLLTADQMKLNYGKLYAVVPQLAIGFSVNTSNSRVIDLGTEFGVQAGSDGSTQLHVMKGKINLLAGITNKVAMEVFQGKAKNVSGSTSQVHDIPVNETEFVRSIDSKQGMIWRGQKQINLADIVGGGNGLGTGTIDMMLDPISGKPSKESWGRREAANDYHRVPSSPYIDGVFIPNGRTRQIISSEGHVFQDCPVTSGLSCDSFSNAERMLNSMVDQNEKVSDSLSHLLLLHSNMGITFDLQAMRNLLPGAKIVRFQSKFGIRKWAARPSASNADFWILVDGKLKHKKTQVKVNSIFDVDIELSENDRFLTLVETDGGDPESRIVDGLDIPAIDSDWGIFANPILVLE
jgi:hypothetical protein